ncbi:MAG: methanogenesis marker 16 metalloprotein [Candidatus Hodarchaeota archaeon]
MAKTRKLSEINAKIKEGKAVVMSVQDLIDRIEDGEKITFDDVDVITTATKGLMSGITGIFSFRLSPPKTVRKFKEVSLNGIPAYPGPCPNEFLGIIDLILYGTGQSKTREEYCGGSLFRELVEGKSIDVVAKSSEGEVIEKTMKLEDMQYARLMGTRQAIKNYSAFVNMTANPVDTIFSRLPFKPEGVELTFSGCGALNPFQNDPYFETFGVGTTVLLNGAIGHLIGPGTRNYVKKPNMMTIGNFVGMKPEYMGAFKTSYGLEPICSIAIPIPILNENILNNIVKSDKDVSLGIMELVGREKLDEITYGDVWDHNYLVKYDPKKCKNCDECPGEEYCPTNAFDMKQGIDRNKCFNCGLCAVECKNREEAFDIDMKSVDFKGKKVPVVLRQSDRFGANKLASQLKNMILNGEFPLVKPTAKLEFASEVK